MLLLYRELQHSVLNKPRISEFQLPEITASPIEICTSKDTGSCCGYKPVFLDPLIICLHTMVYVCTYVRTYHFANMHNMYVCMLCSGGGLD